MSLDPIPTTFAEMQEAYQRTCLERDALQREVVRLREQVSRLISDNTYAQDQIAEAAERAFYAQWR